MHPQQHCTMMTLQGVQECSIPGYRIFSIVNHKYNCHIVHYFDFCIHLAMTGILNFQNRTFLYKVMPCFIKLEKSEFRRMLLSQKW